MISATLAALGACRERAYAQVEALLCDAVGEADELPFDLRVEDPGIAEG